MTSHVDEDEDFAQRYGAAKGYEALARVLSHRLRQMDKRAKAANVRADKAEAAARASDLSDTELLDELHKRRHRFSPDEYMSQDQCDDRAKLGVLRSAIVDLWKQNPSDPALSILHSKCDELDSIYGNPLPARAFAVNTTLPGREDSYDK